MNKLVGGRLIDQVKVDLFISELERRLDVIEEYGNLHLDAGISRAHSTLEAVRNSCSHVSGELIGAGRRRAKILVDTLEERYNDALAARGTLESKAQTSMRLMEGFLADLEARTHSVRDRRFSEIMDEGWRIAEEGLGKAREVVDGSLDKARRAKEALRESIEYAISTAREKGLIRYDELPHPWRVNPYITRGYRFSESKVECLWSAFNLSNELVNIWSHAIGLIIVLAIAFYFYPSSTNFSLSSKTDVFFAAMFFFAACKCLVCSCMWHTMNSIAEQTLMERFACVDYTGISLLIAASIMTGEYTAFYCEPISRWTYIIMTATLGIGGVILPWQPFFNRADMNWFRVAFYVTLAATGFAPIFQLTWTRGPTWSYGFYAPILKSIAVYFIGALIYASQVRFVFFFSNAKYIHPFPNPFLSSPNHVTNTSQTKIQLGPRTLATWLVRLCGRQPQHLALSRPRRNLISLWRHAEFLLRGL
jgi:adiponectin receptor